MRIKINAIKTIITAIIGIVFWLTSASIAQELIIGSQGQLIAAKSIPLNHMIISYNGRSAATQTALATPRENLIPKTRVERPSVLKTVPAKDELLWMSEKIKIMTRNVLKYINFDEANNDESISPFQFKNKIDMDKAVTDEFDLNLSFDFGYDDEQQFTVNAVKLSSYYFSTYVDAVYDYKNNGIDLFLSNSYINTYLFDGMKLEFQVSPRKTGGAFLITMGF